MMIAQPPNNVSGHIPVNKWSMTVFKIIINSDVLDPAVVGSGESTLDASS